MHSYLIIHVHCFGYIAHPCRNNTSVAYHNILSCLFVCKMCKYQPLMHSILCTMRPICKYQPLMHSV